MKYFRKIFFSILALAGIVVIIALVLGRIYEDEITRVSVDAMNRHIRTRVDIENVKLSFLKKFPDATLEFEQVLVRSVQGYNAADFDFNTDTLLFADQLYLQFNVFQILKHKYLIREVQFRNGILRILTDQDGNTNYKLWNSSGESGSQNFLIELEHVNLSQIEVEYINRALEMETYCQMEKTILKGNFSKAEYSMEFDLAGTIRKHSKEEIIFLRDQKVKFSSSLFVAQELIEISSCDLQLAGQKLSVSGDIRRGPPLYLDLAVRGERLRMDQLLGTIGTYNVKIPVDLEAGGELSFDAGIKGETGKTNMPGISANFSISNGWIRTQHPEKEIRQIRTQGKYSNGSESSPATTLVEFTDASVVYGNSRFGGDLSFTDLNHPRITHNIKVELDLADIRQYMQASTGMRAIEGLLLAEVRATGSQQSMIKISREDMLNNRFEARIRLENAGFQLAGSRIQCRDMNGDMTYDGHLQIEAVTAMLLDNYVSCSGRVDNLKEYLFTKKGNLWMDLDVYSDTADLNEMFGLPPGEKVTSNDTLQFPDRIYLKARYWFDQLVFKDFSAGNVMGDLVYRPGRLTVNHLNLSSMEGFIKSEGLIEQQADDQFLVKVISDVSGVDIHKGFAAFNNFGQDFIMEKHLKGILSGKVNFSAGFDERLKIKKESILADYDIIIRNGELVGFEPMQKLSRFINVEELENVRFSTLENQIFIRNNEVLIPGMDINSSAFNISGSGIHGFDKHFEYKVKVSLSELLSGKTDRTDKQAEQFGAIEDDGLGRVYIYLIIEGTPEGTTVRYDRRGALQNIRKQLNEEKVEIKGILNEEFGLFKKDSALFYDSEEGEPRGFMIEWEDQAGIDSTGKSGLLRDNNPDRDQFTITWDDEDESDTLDREGSRPRRRILKR